VAEKIVQIMPAPPELVVCYAPDLRDYKGGPELPQLIKEPVAGMALVEEGSKTWVEAMVIDEDEGGMMLVSDLPGFMAIGFDEGREAASRLATLIFRAQKKYAATPPDTTSVTK
jgi:hypothetical protein